MTAKNAKTTKKPGSQRPQRDMFIATNRSWRNRPGGVPPSRSHFSPAMHAAPHGAIRSGRIIFTNRPSRCSYSGAFHSAQTAKDRQLFANHLEKSGFDMVAVCPTTCGIISVFLTVEMVFLSMKTVSTSIGAISILAVVASILCGGISAVVVVVPILCGTVLQSIGAAPILAVAISPLVGTASLFVANVSTFVGAAWMPAKNDGKTPICVRAI